ncbi:MAG: lytic transglycosylase F [Pseudomonadota bacterium]
MVKRGMIRALVVYDEVFYYLDGFQEKGLTFQELNLFEKELNRDLKLHRGHQVEVIFIPVERDRLIPDLLAGKGDIAAANITVTPEREAKVDFTQPFTEGVDELLVSSPGFPKITGTDGLSGQKVAVRPQSSFHGSLLELNKTLTAAGKDPVDIIEVDANLTDGAITQLVSEGLYPATLLDSYETQLWHEIFPKLQIHKDVALRKDAKIAWAIRKDSPKLKKELDRFVRTHKFGTRITNILVNRYLKNPHHVRHAMEMLKHESKKETVKFFKTYADQYEFDWLLLIAQGYQESKLDQNLRSAAGAVGLMQLLPSTAAGPPIEIRDISKAGPNVHAGAKYMRYILDTYFNDASIPPQDQHMLALAGYNAGPNRIAGLRKRAKAQGLDPNRWFGSMEVLVARTVGRQPVDYVRNIFEYYVAYTRAQTLQQAEVMAGEATKADE